MQQHLTNLETLPKQMTFESFNRDLPGVRIAYARALHYANHPFGWMLLIGPSGCGKSHLAASIARQRRSSGDVVVVQFVPGILDYFCGAFALDMEWKEDDMSRFEQMCDANLLVLDDYDAQQCTSWASGRLSELMNYRYNRELPTIITTTNATLRGINPYTRSRMCDRELVDWVRMEGARSYRVHGDGQEQGEDD
jgi:DNA replication protein DnaC